MLIPQVFLCVQKSGNNVNTGGDSGGGQEQTVEIKDLYFKGQTLNDYHTGGVLNADSQIVYATWSQSAGGSNRVSGRWTITGKLESVYGGPSLSGFGTGGGVVYKAQCTKVSQDILKWI